MGLAIRVGVFLRFAFFREKKKSRGVLCKEISNREASMRIRE